MDQRGNKEDWPKITNAYGTEISIAPRRYVVKAISQHPITNNQIVKTVWCCDLYPQLQESTRASEAPRFSFPTVGSRQWEDAISVFNQHQPSNYTQGAVQSNFENPGERTLHATNDVDSSGQSNSPHDIHHSYDRRRGERDTNSTKQTRYLQDDVPGTDSLNLQTTDIDDMITAGQKLFSRNVSSNNGWQNYRKRREIKRKNR